MAIAFGFGCGQAREATSGPEIAVMEPAPRSQQAQPVGDRGADDATAPGPAADPGGQSGSDSDGQEVCPGDEVALGPDTPTPLGPSAEALVAGLSDFLSQHGALALDWTDLGWKPTATSLTLTVTGEARAIDTRPCAPARVHMPALITLVSEDGRLDQAVPGTLQIRDLGAGAEFAFDGAVLGDGLAGSALADALPTATPADAALAVAPDDLLQLDAAYRGGSVSGALSLLKNADGSRGPESRLVQLATFTSDVAAPAPRVAIAPPPGLSEACANLSLETLALEPPQVPDSERLTSLSGTWVLCAGDRAAPIAIDHAALAIDGQGRFVTALAQDGELVAQTGFGHEGTIAIHDAQMCVGSNCLEVRSTRVDNLLFPSDVGYAAGGAARIELSADRDTMRWFAEVDGDPLLELVYARVSLTPAAPGPVAFEAGERAGADACRRPESDLRHTASPAELGALLVGSWTYCAGAPTGSEERLLFGADGRYRALTGSGEALHGGDYAITPGNPPGTYYVTLLGDDGEARALFEQQVSDRPLKLLVHQSSGERIHTSVLSALP